MGGNAWAMTGPYQEDLAAAFRAEQERELAEDDQGFPGRTLDELWNDEEWQEYIFTGGTCSVLDQAYVVEAGSRDDGPCMRPLTEAEIRAWCPDGRPTHAAWETALGTDVLDYPDRGCGNCTVLYEDGRPARIAYWGVTCD
ncbi:hypothetical protein [Streptomyces sp. VRA16 Mangrove soil]|uniref:hypothetical protein n=1 Tax=Streptomyces sp. VRA16 Mangrove soil TaxID=2817434 RepID=UPI001A9EB627|nr:hypothetical protein [Streptomyces sp. VRA16 Mangrove soil]MBO1333155.1 hypothetical protein [Streptomyces sp. VRA16 Mangrove soil]